MERAKGDMLKILSVIFLLRKSDIARYAHSDILFAIVASTTEGNITTK